MSESEQPQIGFFINRHYLHDLSVENPVGRISDEEAPNVRLGMDGKVAATPGGAPAAYLVDIRLTLTAAVEEKVVFLAEATYRVEVELHGIAEQAIPEVLCVEVPTTMFPIMQEILQRNGAYAGYPDMQVAPLDFRARFNQKAS